jgi:hypothetical protein
MLFMAEYFPEFFIKGQTSNNSRVTDLFWPVPGNYRKWYRGFLGQLEVITSSRDLPLITET